MLTVEENIILEGINFEEPKLLLNTFKDLNRQSGSEDEKKAAYYLSDRLKENDISHEILWPEIYLSTPKKAELKIIGDKIDIIAKTPSYSMSTDEKWVDEELIFAKSYRPPYASEGYEYRLEFIGNPKGKIVICEGVSSPDKVDDIVNSGGVAAIFIQAGEGIHEGICTSIWGTPGLEDLASITRIPVVSISNPDGKKLIARMKEGKVRAAVRTSLEETWKKCPLVITKIYGNKEPEKFILLHGHLDSWHKGIGDNALGDATLLEIARVLHANKHKLKRSVWIAWWPGHSTGRYAGSTWFADNYAMDIYENCIAQINCESTGCINSNTYEGMMWTEDVHDFCKELVKEVTDIEPTWIRPVRAGDYSFNNIGVTSFFMRSSTIGKEKREELGYYEVYGCGGNLEWHTEQDDMRLVDESIFIRDTKLYLAGVLKMANADILPINVLKILDSMEIYLNEYQDVAREKFDFTSIFSELNTLRGLLEQFYQIAKEYSLDSRKQTIICEAILKITRKLIRISYTSREEFKHDAAAMVPPIPDIAPILKIQHLSDDKQKFLKTQITRGCNRVLHALKECEQLIKQVIS
jgi:N-acetylated-alpha-linked acidic dipeptidase